MIATSAKAADIRRSWALADPFRVVQLLNLGEGAIRQGSRGLSVRCPAHPDSTPSCTVREGDDGTVQVHCFGPCELRGDVLGLIAAVYGLEVRRDFKEVLRIAADLAGVSPGSAPLPRAPLRTHAPAQYPPVDQVDALWAACARVLDVRAVADWLRSRDLDPGAVEDFDIARAIPEGAALPPWAGQGRRSWVETGHQCIVPLFDCAGELRSLRARRVGGGDGPKTLAPRGCQASGLVMADAGARALLRGGSAFWPEGESLRVVVTEGDPDFLTWSTTFSDADESSPATFGIFAGAWSRDIADRVPNGSQVALRTDLDDAGDRYAAIVANSFQDRCEIFRGAQ